MQVFDQWSAAAVAAYLEHFRFIYGWSNLLLGVVIFSCLILSLRDDRRQLKVICSKASLFFISILCVNTIATVSHMIEYYPPIAMTLGRELDYFNFATLGFCALWIELFVLERVSFLKSHGLLRGFPRKTFVATVLTLFLTFQYVNWVIRHDPDFIFAILDYMTSLFILLLFALYVIVYLPKSINKKYEMNSVYTFATMLVASLCQIFLADALPRGESNRFHYNDLYHVIAAAAFYFIYRAKINVSAVTRE